MLRSDLAPRALRCAACWLTRHAPTASLIALFLWLTATPAVAVGPPGDYGDAPNGVDAYPPNLVLGHFPTCWGSADGVVVHLGGPLTVHFGDMMEYEVDGNAGACWVLPGDQDECSSSPDAGLIVPTAFTIDGVGTIVTCTPAPDVPLGPACGTATWGGAINPIDIRVVNGFPAVMYVNVLIDWNQDGRWGGAPPCGLLGPAEEHVLKNFPIPAPFAGALSLLAPPSFRIGPNDGFVWARFNISEVPVPLPWFGAGTFDLGETEDYLLRISPTVADVSSRLEVTSGLALEAGVPNPFRSRIDLAYTLGTPGVVGITVVDAAGRVVAHLGNGWQPAGRHPLAWDGTADDGRSLPAGAYFVRVRAGALVGTTKVARVD